MVDSKIMQKITREDILKLKKKVLNLMGEIETLEKKISDNKIEKDLNLHNIIIFGLIKGKKKTSEIKSKKDSIAPYNNSANELLKKGIIKANKTKISGTTIINLNYFKIIEIIKSSLSNEGSIFIPNVYTLLNKELNMNKEESDLLIKEFINLRLIKLIEGDPMDYSGKTYSNEQGRKFHYIIIKRE